MKHRGPHLHGQEASTQEDGLNALPRGKEGSKTSHFSPTQRLVKSETAAHRARANIISIHFKRRCNVQFAATSSELGG